MHSGPWSRWGPGYINIDRYIEWAREMHRGPESCLDCVFYKRAKTCVHYSICKMKGDGDAHQKIPLGDGDGGDDVDIDGRADGSRRTYR